MAKNKVKAPKILILDIETSPIVSYTWGIYDQNVAPNMIKQDSFIMSWAAKWLDSKRLFQADQRAAKDITNDKAILLELWDLMDEADIILGQNSQAFDVKRINARFIEHGMKPPSPYQQIDTLKLAKKNFAFTSNKLEHLSKRLNPEDMKKSEHSKFPGFKLWTECLAGNKAAWREMAKYNLQDVLATEALFKRLAPWGTPVNFGAFFDGELTCQCGSTEFHKDGYRYTASGCYQSYECKRCGAKHKGERVK